jgi:PiT family inorganic phosphate transporter
MVLSPFFGFAMGLTFMVLISWLFFRVTRSVATRLFKRLQLISACFMAFSHGANDAQKAMGIITLALLTAGQIPSAEVPTWVIGACAVAMGLGTAAGGWRIVRTLGMNIVKLEPVHGFAAETGAATVLMFTAHIGLPVSTTHTITSSVMGVGAIKRLSAVRWGVTRRILYAWLFTLPGLGCSRRSSIWSCQYSSNPGLLARRASRPRSGCRSGHCLPPEFARHVPRRCA